MRRENWLHALNLYPDGLEEKDVLDGTGGEATEIYHV
jgi:hypothetical protein